MGRRINFETDELGKVNFIEFILMGLILFLSTLNRLSEKSLITFGFIFEFVVLVFIFRAHFKSIENKNFTYWGVNFLLVIYVLRMILQYTFIEYNVMILYVSVLSLTALAINSYIMSSPLFYPRVQWWEYDFRYRGDLKARAEIENEVFKSRLIDLRREVCCIELFENIPLESKIKVAVNYEGKIYPLEGIVKTSRQDIPGRQIRYGVKLMTDDLDIKKDYLELKRKWHNRKKVKLRNKFKDIKNGIDIQSRRN